MSVTGNYAGHNAFYIVIRDGHLLIVNDTLINGDVSFDKLEYFVNETTNLKVNGTVKVNLSKDFVLNKNSFVVSLH